MVFSRSRYPFFSPGSLPNPGIKPRSPASKVDYLPGESQGKPNTPIQFSSVQSVSSVWLCNPMNCSTPGLPVHHQLPEFTQTHVHWVSDAIQPSHPLSFPSPPTFNLFQHQGLFQWVSSSHQVAKVLEHPNTPLDGPKWLIAAPLPALLFPAHLQLLERCAFLVCVLEAGFIQAARWAGHEEEEAQRRQRSLANGLQLALRTLGRCTDGTVGSGNTKRNTALSIIHRLPRSCLPRCHGMGGEIS